MKLYRCSEKRVNKTHRGTASPSSPTPVGSLYLVATPIGHPDDLTLRALRILSEVDLVAAEQPESTRQLLMHHGIDKSVTSYGPLRLNDKIAVLMARMKEGARIALVSDCGTPILADPGCLLVAAAYRAEIPVRSIPGPSALTAAAAISGFPCDELQFQGSLPDTKSGLQRCLVDRVKQGTCAVLFCTPSSIAETLRTIARLAPRRQLTLACDLTTPTETIVRGTAGSTLRRLRAIRSPQAITLILEGRKPEKRKRPKKR